MVGGQLIRGEWNERMKFHKHEIQTDDESVTEQSWLHIGTVLEFATHID